MNQVSGFKKNALLHLVLIIGGIISLFPFYWLTVISTNTTGDMYRIPPKLVFGPLLIENIKKVFDNTDFLAALLNTAFVATVSTVLVLFFCSLAGFFFAKFRFPGIAVLFSILMVSMMLPSQLSLIPSFILISKLGWISTFKALIIPGMAPAFAIFWMRQYAMDAIHDELLDAGRMDGCNDFRLFWNIGLPILRPALAFQGLFSFIGVWNDYLWPLVVISDSKKYTLQIAIAQLNSIYAMDYAMVLAGTFLATVPLVIIFLIFNKQFISNIAAGAIK